MKNSLFCQFSSLFSVLHLELAAGGQKSEREGALSMFSYSDNLISPFMNCLESLNSEDKPFQLKRREETPGSLLWMPYLTDTVSMGALSWCLCFSFHIAACASSVSAQALHAGLALVPQHPHRRRLPGEGLRRETRLSRRPGWPRWGCWS